MTELLTRIAALGTSLEQARPSALRSGSEIQADGQVDFTEQGERVVAVVDGMPRSARRRVTFTAETDAVRWRCTCTRYSSPWCKHAIAAIQTAVHRGSA